MGSLMLKKAVVKRIAHAVQEYHISLKGIKHSGKVRAQQNARPYFIIEFIYIKFSLILKNYCLYVYFKNFFNSLFWSYELSYHYFNDFLISPVSLSTQKTTDFYLRSVFLTYFGRFIRDNL